MHTKPRVGFSAEDSRPRAKAGQAMLLASLTFTLFVFTLKTNGVLAVDCEGEPYGTSGCPLKGSSSSSVSSIPDSCGNNITDAGEECDMGRFNGARQCTIFCTLLFCGDGKLSPEIGEECEPLYDEFYETNPETGDLDIVKHYKQNACGTVCQVPGTGGCTQKFLNACTAQHSSTNTLAGGEVPPSSGSETHAAAPASSSASSQPQLKFGDKCGNGVVDNGEQNHD